MVARAEIEIGPPTIYFPDASIGTFCFMHDLAATLEPATLAEGSPPELGNASAARCVCTTLLQHWANGMLDAGRVATVAPGLQKQGIPPGGDRPATGGVTREPKPSEEPVHQWRDDALIGRF